MGEMLQELQYRIKTSSTSLVLMAFKLVSGVALGLTVALIFEQILQYGTLSFTFVIVAVTAAFWRVARSWQFVAVSVFDLICILIALLLRMYILVAPGS